MKLVILRSSLSNIDNNCYNSQEIGLAKALFRNAGIKANLIMGDDGNGERKITTEDYNLFYLTFSKLKQAIGYFHNLYKTLDSIKPDLIQVHDLGMFESYRAVKWAKRNNVACVLIQGPYDESRKPLFRCLEKSFNRVFGSYILRNVDAIGCKTFAASNYLKHYCGKISPVITPIGLDTFKFFNESTNAVLYKKSLGFDLGDRILVYVGSVDCNRRHVDLLIESLQFLPDNYKLIIVGDGKSKSELQKKKNDRIKWMGKLSQEKLSDIYNISELFLLASDYEIYGMVILEAMYHNVPVLATATGGAESIIKNNENGYLLPIDSSAESWAVKIKSIFDDLQLYEAIKKNTRVYIEKYLTWDKACVKFLDLYKEALRHHNGIS